MIGAGVGELREFHLGEPLERIAEAVYLMMETERKVSHWVTVSPLRGSFPWI